MIWLLEKTEGLTEAQLAPLAQHLSVARRRRIAELRREENRIDSTLAELLLRYGYAKEYGGLFPEIVLTDRGKPQFADPAAPCFNLSHCRTAVACAISRQPVGVDVQPLHAYDQKFRRILSEKERAWIETSEADARLTALWTRKEAYGKACGVGIGYDMSSTAFSGAFAEPTPVSGWLLWTVARDGYFLSACAKETLELRTVFWQALET